MAAARDQTWRRYLDVLRGLLALHREWIVWIEHDCDQHPIARERMSAEELVARLDEQRAVDFLRLALIASSW